MNDREWIASRLGLPIEAVRADMTIEEFIAATKELIDSCSPRNPSPESDSALLPESAP